MAFQKGNKYRFQKGHSKSKGKNLNKSNGKLILKDGKKLCPTCEEWKTLSEYHKRSERPIGVRSKCKSCEFISQRKDMVALRLTQYKHGAKRRGIEWRLTKDEFKSFWQKPCYYCGDSISTVGLDRINNDECYSLVNIVPCCAICNTMKLALPRDVFIEHCYKVVKNQTIDITI